MALVEVLLIIESRSINAIIRHVAFFFRGGGEGGKMYVKSYHFSDDII